MQVTGSADAVAAQTGQGAGLKPEGKADDHSK